ncbi:cell division transport system ATP-binding protein [Glaciecola punicea ACAM 611]|jgi:cell division transport system ATP-binding protein|uniref:Cell division ATP-binding protein FtsE n=1 Tax=Glaciecola punicea ACAM 611 TaxID=1121923 RepID=H5TEU7_9ALTE|nr:cell division ATP-binding protein FtsE [Glaciecola punicea]OFA32677.1 cell division ATP-binding protein FtsE [Glaciecola punicea]GAB56874.1 cell division transport system ATP-binding protein [Glaciecola punicea ACAM 611]
MIKFEEVSKTYPGGQQALSKVDFHVEQGEMAFLTGHSGAGKSTLLKLISLMERPNVGRVLINGHDLGKVKRKQVAYIRRDIGMIFQSHQLLMGKSVFDNVALPLIIEGHTRKTIFKRVDAALEMVGLRDKTKSLPITLSGGEQQRVGIARAVVNRPPLLLADEPTGNLDPKLSMEIIRLFEDFNSAGVSVFIATHDLGLIARMKYRTLTLKGGRMITDGLSQQGGWS